MGNPGDIILLWPTVRPTVMLATHQHWIQIATEPQRIRTKVAVNQQKEVSQLKSFPDILVLGRDAMGAAKAVHALALAVVAQPDDILIVASDDMYAPSGWDRWIRDQFLDFNGAIVVNDGYSSGACVTLPIMTFSCLQRLNRVIYHPSYRHQWSDAELFRNLSELGLLRDLRGQSPIFEHRHWANKKRKKDQRDCVANDYAGQDEVNFRERMRLSLARRLGV